MRDRRRATERSSKAPVALPVDRPWHSQGATKQDVRMVARFFVLDAKGIGILCGHNTTIEQPLALLKVKAGQNHGFRQPRIVSSIPEGIGQTHRVRQAEIRTIEIQSAGFSIIAGEDAGVLALLCRQGAINLGDGARQVRPANLFAKLVMQLAGYLPDAGPDGRDRYYQEGKEDSAKENRRPLRAVNHTRPC